MLCNSSTILFFTPLDEPAEELRDIHQRRALVAELADLARLFTATVKIVIDRDFGQRRHLLAGQLRKVEHRVAARPHPHVVHHIGEPDAAKLPVVRDNEFRAVGRPLMELSYNWQFMAA
jgi:hypothetical protein